MVNYAVYYGTRTRITTMLDVVRFGGLFSACVANGEAWRLISCAFLHADDQHIGSNMITLFLFGSITERLLGPWRYLMLYMLAACAGSMAIMLSGWQYTASGASAVTYGFVVAAAITTPIAFWRHQVRWRLGYLFVYGFLIYCMVTGVQMEVRSADIMVSGHVGGAVAGLLFCGGVMLRRRLPERATRQFAYVTITAWVLASCYVGYGVSRWLLGPQDPRLVMRDTEIGIDLDGDRATILLRHPLLWGPHDMSGEHGRTWGAKGVGLVRVKAVECRDELVPAIRDAPSYDEGSVASLMREYYREPYRSMSGAILTGPATTNPATITAMRLEPEGLVTLSFIMPGSEPEANVEPVIGAILNGTRVMSCHRIVR
jgi:membrane associated rhomboid family serine protease